MAVKLDLVPDPITLVIQGVMFMIGYVIIDKLMLQPYLKLRGKREALTSGRQDDATQALQQVEQLSSDITKRITSVVDEERKKREEIRSKAVAEREQLLGAAETAARAEVNSVTTKIQARLAEEKAKVPNVVAQLTNDVFELATKS